MTNALQLLEHPNTLFDDSDKRVYQTQKEEIEYLIKSCRNLYLQIENVTPFWRNRATTLSKNLIIWITQLDTQESKEMKIGHTKISFNEISKAQEIYKRHFPDCLVSYSLLLEKVGDNVNEKAVVTKAANFENSLVTSYRICRFARENARQLDTIIKDSHKQILERDKRLPEEFQQKHTQGIPKLITAAEALNESCSNILDDFKANLEVFLVKFTRNETITNARSSLFNKTISNITSLVLSTVPEYFHKSNDAFKLNEPLDEALKEQYLGIQRKPDTKLHLTEEDIKESYAAVTKKNGNN